VGRLSELTAVFRRLSSTDPLGPLKSSPREEKRRRVLVVSQELQLPFAMYPTQSPLINIAAFSSSDQERRYKGRICRMFKYRQRSHVLNWRAF